MSNFIQDLSKISGINIDHKFDLPVQYDSLTINEKRAVKDQYIKQQNNLCAFCGYLLTSEPPFSITSKDINWKLFPEQFLKYNVHLQHNHKTGLTEGVVHAYCNAVMWQYNGQ